MTGWNGTQWILNKISLSVVMSLYNTIPFYYRSGD